MDPPFFKLYNLQKISIREFLIRLPFSPLFWQRLTPHSC
jgi:hypothetical protein